MNFPRIPGCLVCMLICITLAKTIDVRVTRTTGGDIYELQPGKECGIDSKPYDNNNPKKLCRCSPSFSTYFFDADYADNCYFAKELGKQKFLLTCLLDYITFQRVLWQPPEGITNLLHYQPVDWRPPSPLLRMPIFKGAQNFYGKAHLKLR